MSRPMPLVLLAGLAGLAVAADDPAPPAKLPKFKDYMTLPDAIVTKLKDVEDDTLTVLLTEVNIRQTSRKRPPTVKTKEREFTFTLHPDALVRWSKKPDRRDDKGRPKPYSPAEMKVLQSPTGAPGYLGDRQELAAGQVVELTLLVPTKKLPDDLREEDVRIKWVVIQGAPPDPKDAKPKTEKK